MSRKSELKYEVRTSEDTIEALEKKLFRSQTVLMLALVDGQTPDPTEVGYFKTYATLIEQERKKLIGFMKELEDLS